MVEKILPEMERGRIGLAVKILPATEGGRVGGTLWKQKT